MENSDAQNAPAGNFPKNLHETGDNVMSESPIVDAVANTTTDEPATPVDMVNHPPHYSAHPSGVECIQIVEHMGFNIGNAIKYLWRADKKGAPLEDLKKAEWYVKREIQRRSG